VSPAFDSSQAGSNQRAFSDNNLAQNPDMQMFDSEPLEEPQFKRVRSNSISGTQEGRQKLGRLNRYTPNLKHRGSVSLASDLDSIEEENSSKSVSVSNKFSKKFALQEI
jgi:hypothetical protein